MGAGGGSGTRSGGLYGCDPRYEGDRCDEEGYRGCDVGGTSLRCVAASSAMRNVPVFTNASNPGDEEGGPLSVRDFFQICSVGEGRSSVSFLFFEGGADGLGGGGSSSSESSVKSMMSAT